MDQKSIISMIHLKNKRCMTGVRKKHRFDSLMLRNIADINKRSKIKCSLLCRITTSGHWKVETLCTLTKSGISSLRYKMHWGAWVWQVHEWNLKIKGKHWFVYISAFAYPQSALCALLHSFASGLSWQRNSTYHLSYETARLLCRLRQLSVRGTGAQKHLWS